MTKFFINLINVSIVIHANKWDIFKEYKILFGSISRIYREFSGVNIYFDTSKSNYNHNTCRTTKNIPHFMLIASDD